MSKFCAASVLSVAFFITSCLSSMAYSQDESLHADLAITNVDVFDSRTKTVQSAKTVLIEGDRILAIVGANDEVAADQFLDGRNRLLVPGFIDTHAHLGQIYMAGMNPGDPIGPPPTERRAELSRQYLAHGTTTLVDMGQADSWLDNSLNWQSNPGPDFPNLYITGGSLISANNDENPPHFVQVTPATVEAKLADYKSRGINHIKLYRRLELTDMKATIAAADALGLRYYSHTDNSVVTISEALALGASDFEHFFTLVPSTLPFREQMEPLLESRGLDGIGSDDEYAATMVFFFAYINERPEYRAKMVELMEEMAARNASLSTTINVLASAAGRTQYYCTFTPVAGATEPELSYNAEQKAQLKDSFDEMMSFVKLALDTGVTLRIGTDCWNGGRALLAELLILREAGISAEDTLQIATWNGAKSLGLETELGHIAPGKRADMILFEQNPLGDPQNIMSDMTIIKSGRVYAQ